VAGYGSLAGWEDKWEALPEVMASVCSEAEYISSRRLASLDEFKTGLLRLGVPSLVNGVASAGIPVQRTIISDSGFIPLVPDDEDKITEQVSGYLTWLKKSDSTAPEAVFIGGTQEKSCLCVFRKPLDVNNALRLLKCE
jgi:hypothetical protein